MKTVTQCPTRTRYSYSLTPPVLRPASALACQTLSHTDAVVKLATLLHRRHPRSARTRSADYFAIMEFASSASSAFTTFTAARSAKAAPVGKLTNYQPDRLPLTCSAMAGIHSARPSNWSRMWSRTCAGVKATRLLYGRPGQNSANTSRNPLAWWR